MAFYLDQGSIDLNVEGRDLREVLELLFQLMGAKFELPPEVEGTTTVSLHQLTYRQALETILGHEFTYDIGPHDVIYVHKRGTTWRPGWEEAA